MYNEKNNTKKHKISKKIEIRVGAWTTHPPTYLRFLLLLDYACAIRGFVKLKKIREKLGSGWVGQAPTRISIFLEILCFFVLFFSLYMFPKNG